MEKKSHTKYKHETFGNRLNTIMVHRNISNQRLASMLTLSATTISGYRTGRRAPSAEELIRLADALHVSVDYLIGRSDSELQNPET